MSKLTANRVLSGSFAELWIDGNRIAEASSIRLSVKVQRTDVQLGLDIDSKITGYQGEGELQLRQVFTRFYDILQNMQQGKDVRLSITTALKDPDSSGGQEERYSIGSVALSELPLVNYTTGKINEQTIRFRFLPGEMKNLAGISITEVA